MTPVETAEAKTVAPFPTGEVEACIRDYLAEEGGMQAVLHGDSKPPTGTIGPQPVIDSLVVVEVLIELEPKVPFPLPEDLVRAGGYDTVDDVVQHLIPQLEKRWRKHHEEKK